MASIEQFRDEVRWTAAEKRVARKAFDQARERHLSAITAEGKRMMANVADPTDLWQLEAYLSESRKTVDRIYQFRYSDLLQVFSVHMRDDWLKEADLVGLQPEKIADIKRSAKDCAECSANRPKLPHSSSIIDYPRGSIPIRSFTASRSRCLQPKYFSVVCTETCPRRN
jgi:Photoprotection regulator fluorescence recovery protein